MENTFTLQEKKDFFKFALDAFINKRTAFGFCALFSQHFGFHVGSDFKKLPELMKHKPKKHFYNYKNEKTDDIYQFWFPIGTGDNKKRIKICKKILAKLG